MKTNIEATAWNGLQWMAKESFLRQNGFKLGWSSHTWRYLPREIQAKWELRQNRTPQREG